MGKRRDRAGVKRTPREELKRLIYATAACLESNGTRPTVSSVTRHLRYSPSTYFRGIMDEMVDDGQLLRYQELHWNGRKAFVYLIPETPLEKEVRRVKG